MIDPTILLFIINVKIVRNTSKTFYFVFSVLHQGRGFRIVRGKLVLREYSYFPAVFRLFCPFTKKSTENAIVLSSI